LKDKIPGLNVVVISFDAEGDKEKLKKYLSDNGAAMPVVIADTQKEDIGAAYQIKYIPFSVLVNPEGRIVLKALRGDEMYDAIKEAMAAK